MVRGLVGAAGPKKKKRADEPRPGVPQIMRDTKVQDVVTRTLEAPLPGRNAREHATDGESHEGLARDSCAHVAAFGLQPHRTETFKLSADPARVAAAPGRMSSTHRHEEFLLCFLDRIDAAVPPHPDVHLSWTAMARCDRIGTPIAARERGRLISQR